MADLYRKNLLPFAPSGDCAQEQNRKAYLLYTLGWVWAIVVTLCIGVMIPLLPDHWLRGVIDIGIIDGSVIACLLLNRAGYFNTASSILIAGLWSLLTFMAFSAGGMSSEAVVAYLPIIVTTGLLLGGWWGIAMAVICLLTTLGMALLDMYGLMPARAIAHTPLTLWFGYSASGIMTAVMQFLAHRQSKRAFEQLSDAQQEIVTLNESLEKKVEERTAALYEANKELETFNYSVSHDLQAPLRVVNGFAKILLNDHSPRLNADEQHFLKAIYTNSIQMGHLIRGLLEFSRSGRGSLSKEEVDMDLIVASIIDEVKVTSGNPTMEIIVHKLTKANSDPNLIKQVWANLILNAVKFSGKKERPMVEIGDKTSGDQLIYYVKDNGVGFDMQYGTKLFSAFQRLHSNKDFEGSGIGLATTHRIINRHGGKIWVEARPDEGATFYFTIPSDN